ncbi:MAG: ABC transporter permease subunit [Candidatus Hydrogenedentota bacterium]
MSDNLTAFLEQESPKKNGYLNSVVASYGQATLIMIRQRRIIFATLICFLPVLIPLLMAFVSRSQFGDPGLDTFLALSTTIYVTALCPLLALFFATMLIGQDVEAHTIPYILTRPLQRSAWVFGKFLSFLTIAGAIMGIALILLFGACTALADFAINIENVQLLFHLWIATIFGMLGYGSLTMFLGAVSKRPIIIGVILIYAWQPVAMFVPGYIDFFTIRKYISAIMPSLAAQSESQRFETAFGDFEKHFFTVGLPEAMLTLIAISLGFMLLTVITVRRREYASAHALGS